MADMTKQKRYYLKKKELSSLMCALCDEATLWEHRHGCPKWILRDSTPAVAGECSPVGFDDMYRVEEGCAIARGERGLPCASTSQPTMMVSAAQTVCEPRITPEETPTVSGKPCFYADSQRYTVRRRCIVIRYHIPFRIPVPLSSDDSSVEVPASQRIRRGSPIQFPDSPGDVMALSHSSPSPPTLKSQRRPTEDAILSKMAGPSTTQLATTPLSPQHMPTYANKWQNYFERMLSNLSGLRNDMALMMAKLDSIICRLDARNTTAYEPLQANNINDLLKLEEDLAILDNFTGTVNALKRHLCTDLGSSIRRMLASLIGENLVLMCNWTGTAKKIAVGSFKFPKAVIDALKSTNRFRESSTLEIEHTMKRWFTDARDRGLGRKTARSRRETI